MGSNCQTCDQIRPSLAGNEVLGVDATCHLDQCTEGSIIVAYKDLPEGFVREKMLVSPMCSSCFNVTC